MSRRHEARATSTALLKDVLSTHKLRESSARGARAQTESEGASGWWTWFGRLHSELDEEKSFITPTYDGLVKPPEESEKQLATWQAKLDFQNSQCSAALKLVFKFKADAHAARKRLMDDSWARLTDPSFPKEVLIMVIEAAVRHGAPYLDPELLKSPLGRVVDQIFTRWPENLGNEALHMIYQMAARALLKHSIFRIETGFTIEHTLGLPFVLEGVERFIRHLALDLRTMPVDGAHNFQLTRSSQAMESTRSLLPNLETCILQYHFIHGSRRPFLRSESGEPGSIETILSMINVKKVNDVTKLETTIVESLSAFREYGPGKRKFVRFSHYGREKKCLSTGPLVRVDDDVSLSDLSRVRDSTSVEDASMASAKRLFERAYWHDPRWRSSP